MEIVYQPGYVQGLLDRIRELEAALRQIARSPDEDSEWDGADKYRDCRDIAREVLGPDDVSVSQRATAETKDDGR
jgi:hypothetical protein